MYPKGRIGTKTKDPEQVTHYGTACFQQHKFELYRLVIKTTSRTRWHWFVQCEGQAEGDFDDTGSPSPEAAIGLAILNLQQNQELAQQIYG